MKLYLVKHIFECKRNMLASCITQIILKYIQPRSPIVKKKKLLCFFSEKPYFKTASFQILL